MSEMEIVLNSDQRFQNLKLKLSRSF